MANDWKDKAPAPKIDEGEMRAIVEMAEKLPSIAIGESGITFATLRDVYVLARIIIASGWFPKGIDTPEKVMTCLFQARALGIDPYVALWNTAPIGNRPTIFGDLVPALCMGRKGVTFEEWWEVDGSRVERRPSYAKRENFPDSLTACCRVISKEGKLLGFGQFSVADAKLAKVEEWRGYGERREKVSYPLWDKEGPWQSMPWRQLRFRALTFAARDGCADVLKGVGIFEEIQEIGDAALEVEHIVRETRAPIGPMPPLEPTLKAEDVVPSDEIQALMASLRRASGAQDKERLLAFLDEKGLPIPKPRTLKAALEMIAARNDLELVRQVSWLLAGKGQTPAPLATSTPPPEGERAPADHAKAQQEQRQPEADGQPVGGVPSAPEPPEESPPMRILRAKIADKKVTEHDLNAIAGALYKTKAWTGLPQQAMSEVVQGFNNGTIWNELEKVKQRDRAER